MWKGRGREDRLCVSDVKLKESKTAFTSRYDCYLPDHLEVTRIVRAVEGIGF
jgi:hypothetical protein